MAIATAYVATSMPDISVWYGQLGPYDSNSIEISAGNRLVRYFGDFTYNFFFGGVSGTLYAVEEYRDGTLIYDIRGLDVDASAAYDAIQIRGDARATAELVLSGDDEMNGSSGDDVAQGYAGNDIIRGNGGDDVLLGGTGNDTLRGGAGNDTAAYSGASGGVQVYLAYNKSLGADGRDRLYDIENLVGSFHDDRLIGDENNNDLKGGWGNDVLKGKGGDDVFFGGYGDDRMIGGSGMDEMRGDVGSDILIGLAGNDLLMGGADRDFLFGGRDEDELQGDAGNDALRGNLGNDVLFGGRGDDDLRGGGSNDTLDGGRDNDYLFGGRGSDTLTGGQGDDVMSGGDGGGVKDGFADTFVFGSSSGNDRIRDFEVGRDMMDLTAYGFNDFDTDVAPMLTQLHGGFSTLLTLDSSNSVQLDGVNLAELNADDFILA